MRYKGVEINMYKNKCGEVRYRIKSPVNGKPRIFDSENILKDYIDHAEALESMGDALARNPW